MMRDIPPHFRSDDIVFVRDAHDALQHSERVHVLMEQLVSFFHKVGLKSTSYSISKLDVAWEDMSTLQAECMPILEMLLFIDESKKTKDSDEKFDLDLQKFAEDADDLWKRANSLLGAYDASTYREDEKFNTILTHIEFLSSSIISELDELKDHLNGE